MELIKTVMNCEYEFFISFRLKTYLRDAVPFLGFRSEYEGGA
jgi:hypothetical protein